MTETSAPPLARATWSKARLWVLLLVLVVIGGVIVAAISRPAARPLDPGSAAHNGSRALAQLLGQRGTTVRALTAPDDADAAPSDTTVLVIDPDDLSSDQLRALAGHHRLVLVEPDVASLAAVDPSVQRDDVTDSGATPPNCSWPGAAATGAVTFPLHTVTYTGPATCYGGAVVITDRLVILGSGELLRNDRLANNNIAALDLNSISNDGAVTQVAWLLPGVADAGSGSPSVWSLFPPWAQRAFWWLLVVGVLLALWRGRRLGPVVSEPLPVVVRAAEVVEGHGRLYLRAGARTQAAGVLRAAAARRLAVRLGLDQRTPPIEVARVLDADRAGRPSTVLAGPAPVDDAALLRLAADLDGLEGGTVRTHD